MLKLGKDILNESYEWSYIDADSLRYEIKHVENRLRTLRHLEGLLKSLSKLNINLNRGVVKMIIDTTILEIRKELKIAKSNASVDRINFWNQCIELYRLVQDYARKNKKSD